MTLKKCYHDRFLGMATDYRFRNLADFPKDMFRYTRPHHPIVLGKSGSRMGIQSSELYEIPSLEGGLLEFRFNSEKRAVCEVRLKFK
jgi:hypothetical protein